MVLHLRAFLCSSFLLVGFIVSTSSGEAASQKFDSKNWTQWADDYAKALQMSQDTGRPLLIAFLGTGWCPWSIRMEENILSKPEFSTALREEMLFVRIDFPEQDILPLEKKTQYWGLKRRYGIQELPTLVLVDPSGDEIIKVGYAPQESKEMAALLQTALADYRQLKSVVGSPRLLSMKAAELQELYKKATALSTTPLSQEILEIGLKSDQDDFFLLAQYETLLADHTLHDPQVQNLRRKIATRDPSGIKGLQLKLATADFQILSRHLKKKEDPFRAIAPLVDYLQKFGGQDSANSWRVEMMIAQFLFSKNKVAEAITHAKNSYREAPEEFRPEIAKTVEYLSKKNG